MGHYGSRLTFIGSKACLIFFLQVVLGQQIFWIKHSYFLNFDHSRILMKFYKILSRYKIFQLFCYFDKWKHVYPNSISPILFMTQWLIFLQFQSFDILALTHFAMKLLIMSVLINFAIYFYLDAVLFSHPLSFLCWQRGNRLVYFCLLVFLSKL